MGTQGPEVSRQVEKGSATTGRSATTGHPGSPENIGDPEEEAGPMKFLVVPLADIKFWNEYRFAAGSKNLQIVDLDPKSLLNSLNIPEEIIKSRKSA